MEPNYWCDNNTNEYYYLLSVLQDGDSGMPETTPLYGIASEESGGYIAFATSQESADEIIKALNA